MAHCDLEVLKFLDYKMHRDADLEDSVSMQTEHNRESAVRMLIVDGPASARQ